MTIARLPRDFSRCTITDPCKRKLFWATQPDACKPETDECGNECARLGLRFLDTKSSISGPVTGRTIDVFNWVRGLAINILMTDGEVDETDCGVRPGLRGGHWSQIFAGDGATFGTTIRKQSIPCSVVEAPQTVAAILQYQLGRLVTYGVAKAVMVTAKYVGRGVVAVNIDIIGENGSTARVAINGSRIANAWVWA